MASNWCERISQPSTGPARSFTGFTCHMFAQSTQLAEVHTLALTDDGHVYSFGGGSYGQLGVKDRRSCVDQLPSIFGLRPVVRCGGWVAYHLPSTHLGVTANHVSNESACRSALHFVFPLVSVGCQGSKTLNCFGRTCWPCRWMLTTASA